MISYNTPVLKIPSATPSNKDAAQYLIRYKKVQYNLCGQFCVAFCAQDEAQSDNIDEFLDYWSKNEKLIRSFFPNWQSRTTSIYDLESMLREYGYKTPCQRFSDLNNPSSLEAVSTMLATHQLIAGVKIDWTGYLVGSGTPHWIVVEHIETADPNHAIVNIYNPFSNMIEPYSWREFMTSTGVYKNGIYVER